MGRRRIGQEKFGFVVERGQPSSLDALVKLIDWVPIDAALAVISCAVKGEPAEMPFPRLDRGASGRKSANCGRRRSMIGPGRDRRRRRSAMSLPKAAGRERSRRSFQPSAAFSRSVAMPPTRAWPSGGARVMPRPCSLPSALRMRAASSSRWSRRRARAKRWRSLPPSPKSTGSKSVSVA